MKQRQRPPKSQGKPQRLTKTVTHIRLIEANPGKLATLDQLAPVYLALCQHYVTLFCTELQPDKFHPPVFQTLLSERWHRVAIQQAAGIAHSWRTNREQAYQDYLAELEDYREQQAHDSLDAQAKEPKSLDKCNVCLDFWQLYIKNVNSRLRITGHKNHPYE